MKTKNNLLIFCLTLFLISCEERERVTYNLPNSKIEEVPFIPKPNSIQVGNNAFPFDINTRINVPEGDWAYTNVSKYLAKKLSELTGIDQDKLFSESTIDSRYIYFIPDSSMAQENYRLEINGDSVKV
ncbi:MAG: hypothetical protein R3213_09010, partial [Flavobacteriaceae bacterium]|nr:hypothetical protein [Flavobacteriaceae bacterium]